MKVSGLLGTVWGGGGKFGKFGRNFVEGAFFGPAKEALAAESCFSNRVLVETNFEVSKTLFKETFSQAPKRGLTKARLLEHDLPVHGKGPQNQGILRIKTLFPATGPLDPGRVSEGVFEGVS